LELKLRPIGKANRLDRRWGQRRKSGGVSGRGELKILERGRGGANPFQRDLAIAKAQKARAFNRKETPQTNKGKKVGGFGGKGGTYQGLTGRGPVFLPSKAGRKGGGKLV